MIHDHRSEDLFIHPKPSCLLEERKRKKGKE